MYEVVSLAVKAFSPGGGKRECDVVIIAKLMEVNPRYGSSCEMMRLLRTIEDSTFYV